MYVHTYEDKIIQLGLLLMHVIIERRDYKYINFYTFFHIYENVHSEGKAFLWK